MTTENQASGLKPGDRVMVEATVDAVFANAYGVRTIDKEASYAPAPIFARASSVHPFPAPVWVAHIPKETIRDICGRIVISRNEPLDMGDGYFVGDDIGYMTDILFERLFAIKIAPSECRQFHLFALEART